MTFRILSLDGGGAWALIEVKTLIALFGETATGHQVLSEFDLVAANSGGSLVLGGLIEDLSLKELLDYFMDEGKRRLIFSPLTPQDKMKYCLAELAGIGPRYSSEAKLAAIKTLFSKHGNDPMPFIANSIKRGGRPHIHLMIVGFDYDRNRAAFFRSSSTGESNVWGKGAQTSATLAEAIHASTNAPVNYFDVPAKSVGQGKRYWDGAIAGYNNPVMAAVTEAIVLGHEAKDIVVLSLGTASVVLPPAEQGKATPYVSQRSKPDLLADINKLAKAIVADPPDAATFMAHVVTGGGKDLPTPAVSRIVRMNPLICPVKDKQGGWIAPAGLSAQEFSALCDLDMDAVEQSQVEMIRKYADFWLSDKVPNQPIRMDGTTLQMEIGHHVFSLARDAWGVLR
ncbi:MAG: patatin-like phospholipase family protein [Alphaproteobacteria bacterium]|nr:patatin-like phospholipase family protein [Alphaproteobacteria bacterium]